jgi:hypothetical protein
MRERLVRYKIFEIAHLTVPHPRTLFRTVSLHRTPFLKTSIQSSQRGNGLSLRFVERSPYPAINGTKFR